MNSVLKPKKETELEWMDVCLLFLVEICKQQAYFVNFDFDLFTEQSTKVEA